MSITIVGGGNPSGPTFPVQRSVRLRSSASAYFNRTPATSGNRQIFTISFWFKRGTIGGADLFTGNAGNGFLASFRSDNTLYLYDFGAGVNGFQIYSARVFRDPSAWYHLVIAVDTTQATDSNRIKVYINGIQENLATWTVGAGASRYPSLNANFDWNNTNSHEIGFAPATNGYFDGYLTEFNNVSGFQLDATSFGAYNSYGVWSPAKYTGTYGTNGFYLNFQDNSAATATTIGKDSSGNGNNWTPNNISVTAGTTYDSMLDVPTLTSNTNANYAVINPISAIAFPITNGNLSIGASTTSNRCAKSSIAVSSGKWYWEFKASVISISGQIAGICSVDALFSGGVVSSGFEVGYYSLNGNKYVNGTGSAYGASWTASDTIGVALDVDGGTVTFYKNNTSQGSISITAGQTWVANWTGQNTTDAVDFTFGQRPFSYTPPTGFKSLNTYNLPAPTIPNGATQFAATTYTGTAAALTVTNTVNGVNFQPDFVWIKDRTSALNHRLLDSVRGVTSLLYSNLTDAQVTIPNANDSFTSFNSNGFTLGVGQGMNASGDAYIGWQWKANGTPAVVNTAGTVPSTISVNPTAGFSIVTATSNGADPFTIGHGLGVAPKMVIFKNRSAVDAWYVAHTSLTNMSNCWLVLNTTAAAVGPSTAIFGAGPTSTTIGIRATSLAASGANIVAYCWAEIPGFSKFGSYTGNGSTDGPFVYLGFRPRYILFKATTTAVDATWVIKDTSRNPSNVASANLYANQANAEDTASTANVDILSNGFKLRGTYNGTNGSGQTYIYAAFAENPFSYSLAR